MKSLMRTVLDWIYWFLDDPYAASSRAIMLLVLLAVVIHITKYLFGA